MKYTITAITLLTMAALLFYAFNTDQCISFDLLLAGVSFGSCEIASEQSGVVSYLILAIWVVSNVLFGKFYLSDTTPKIVTIVLFCIGLPGTVFVYLLAQFIKQPTRCLDK